MTKIYRWLKKLFIPHEHNEYRPHFLRHESILLVGFLVIIIELAFLVQVFVVFDKTKFLASVLPGVLTSLTNEEREELGLPNLSENPLLTRAAELKAKDMAEKGYFAHTSPEGKNPWYWLGEVGYAYRYAGENLAVNFFESSDVSRAWMNSPTHKANIVKPVYTEIGIGIAQGVYNGRNTVFVAQFFGTPLADAASVPVNTPKVNVTPPVENPSVAGAEEEAKENKAPQKEPPVETPPLRQISKINPLETIILGEATLEQSREIPKPTNNSFSSKIKEVLSSPLRSVTYVYAGIALLVIFALLLILFIKSELAHPAMIAKGMSLLAVIIILLLANTQVFYARTTVPDSMTANVIEFVAP